MIFEVDWIHRNIFSKDELIFYYSLYFVRLSASLSCTPGSGHPVPWPVLSEVVRDGELKYFHVVWIPAIPAGMTDLCITMRAELEVYLMIN